MASSPRRRAVLLVVSAFTAAVAALVIAVRPPSRAEPSVRPLPVPDARPARLAPYLAQPLSPRIASYRIDARLDTAAHQIQATATLTWTNRGGSPVTELPFHLYMNGFKNETSLFMQSSRGHHRSAEAATDDGWGWIDVASMKIGGAELRPTAHFSGPDETVLELPLPQPVGPGETVAVDLAFTTQLPQVFARTGYKGDFIMVGQWFPKVGVRVGAPGLETWHCRPFHVNSEFFADFGVYDVGLTVPDTHVVAATGVLAEVKENGDRTRTLRYHAEDVHDFAWMADPFMQVVTGTAKVSIGSASHDVEVRVYHRPEQRAFALRHLEAGIASIEGFSALFVPYPWTIMSVIDPPRDAEEGAGGMEYPTLVTTGGDGAVMPRGVRIPEYVTVHEIGHNWFQGILASNEVDEAWLDEGVNEYADVLVMARRYGARGSLVDWAGFAVDTGDIRRVAGETVESVPAPVATASYAFPDYKAYGTATYTKTLLALMTLEHTVGDERMAAAMKAYAEKYAFAHPTGSDFFAALAASTGSDLSWFLQPAFHDLGAVDYRIREVECRPRRQPRGVFGEGAARRTVKSSDAPDSGSFVCEIEVANLGRVPSPTDIEIRFEDGTTQTERWDDRGNGAAYRIALERSSKVAAVVIDPGNKVPLDDTPLESGLRLQGDAAAAWRAAARAGFWTQTAMQVLGL